LHEEAQAAPPGNLDALVNKDLAAFRNADQLLVQAQALVQTYRERYPELVRLPGGGRKAWAPRQIDPSAAPRGDPHSARRSQTIADAARLFGMHRSKITRLLARSDEGSRREDLPTLRQEFKGIVCRLGLLCVNGFPERKTRYSFAFTLPQAVQIVQIESVNAVWSYEEPFPAVEQIRRHVAFYPDRVDEIAQ
jgi:Domain of unknown function (DUF427)